MSDSRPQGWIYRALGWVERIGNKLPDPAMLFVIALVGVGVAEHSGFINAGLKGLIGLTPKMLLSPRRLRVGIPLGLQASYTYP